MLGADPSLSHQVMDHSRTFAHGRRCAYSACTCIRPRAFVSVNFCRGRRRMPARPTKPEIRGAGTAVGETRCKNGPLPDRSGQRPLSALLRHTESGPEGSILDVAGYPSIGAPHDRSPLATIRRVSPLWLGQRRMPAERRFLDAFGVRENEIPPCPSTCFQYGCGTQAVDSSANDSLSCTCTWPE